MRQWRLAQQRNGPLLSATVEALAGTLGLRDEGTGSHSDRVTELACRLGQRLELPGQLLTDLRHAGRLHDIGKVGIPDAVLLKPAALNADEWKVMQGHCSWGANLVERIPGLERVGRIVRHHHERFDGRGYPDGLSGDEIPAGSRILGVADAYVAMSEDRPYRDRLADEEVHRELARGAGTQFDPEVVEALRVELELGQVVPSC
jgi:HD-GYP domain-containing protein (c-di-GMP phosphodiesterase class II)